MDFDAFDRYAQKIKAEHRKEVTLRRGGKPHQGKRSSTYIHHRFLKVRTILNFAHTCRKISPEEIARLRGEWKEPLKVPAKPRRKKYEISPKGFRAMLKAADSELNTSILLVMMNVAGYPKDLRDMVWSDFDLKTGTLVCFREKEDANGYEGTVKIAVLWKRTIQALRALKKKRNPDKDAPVFTINGKTPMHTDTIYDRVCRLRDECGLEHFEARSIRDNAFSVAAKKAPEDQATVLLAVCRT